MTNTIAPTVITLPAFVPASRATSTLTPGQSVTVPAEALGALGAQIIERTENMIRMGRAL